MSISGIHSSLAGGIYASLSSEEVANHFANTAKELESVMKDKGIDQETRDAIQEEIALAIQQMLKEADGGLPSSEEMEAMINEIFSNHGLDADEILDNRLESSDNASPQSLIGSTSSMKTLLDVLMEDDGKFGGADSIQQFAEDMSEILMDFVLGFDQKV
ncbi:MAG: hypothetical protein PVH19_09760 [Planctomycetia bacterium]|jgi:hypothetical protein